MAVQIFMPRRKVHLLSTRRQTPLRPASAARLFALCGPQFLLLDGFTYAHVTLAEKPLPPLLLPSRSAATDAEELSGQKPSVHPERLSCWVWGGVSSGRSDRWGCRGVFSAIRSHTASACPGLPDLHTHLWPDGTLQASLTFGNVTVEGHGCGQTPLPYYCALPPENGTTLIDRQNAHMLTRNCRSESEERKTAQACFPNDPAAATEAERSMRAVCAVWNRTAVMRAHVALGRCQVQRHGWLCRGSSLTVLPNSTLARFLDTSSQGARITNQNTSAKYDSS